jgi:SecD/SecF fusion protein
LESQEVDAADVTTSDDQTGGDFGAQAPADLNITYIDITRELKFDPPISGKTLRSLIVDASQRIDRDIDEDQVIVDSPQVLQDESALTTIADEWVVTMNVTKEADADEIINAWAANFNQRPYFPTSSKVGGQIAKKTQYQALAAIIASLLGIIAYVWIRFQNVAFGLAAVVALIHDVAIVLGAIAISHWLAGALGFLGITEFKISLEIVAALLTVIGYSLNDTIVVFDRIREVRGKRTEITADMINTSISQTLSRTILTSVTTFIVVFILYCFGGEAIHGFAFALVIGVLVGTYSSIFIASPTLLWLMNTVGLNPGVVDPATE